MTKIDVNIVDLDGGILGEISVLVESGKMLWNWWQMGQFLIEILISRKDKMSYTMRWQCVRQLAWTQIMDKQQKCDKKETHNMVTQFGEIHLRLGGTLQVERISLYSSQ